MLSLIGADKLCHTAATYAFKARGRLAGIIRVQAEIHIAENGVRHMRILFQSFQLRPFSCSMKIEDNFPIL